MGIGVGIGEGEAGGRHQTFQIDITYEFCAPHFFDFMNGETGEEARQAECWFNTAATYAASPYVLKIKPRRSWAAETLCSFEEAEKVEQKVSAENSKENGCTFASSTGEYCPVDISKGNAKESADQPICQEVEVRTPQDTSKGNHVSSEASKTNHATCQPSKLVRSMSLKKEISAERSAAQENQAVKRQKLEAGRLLQILNIKEHILPHKVQLHKASHKELTVAMDKGKERKWNSASKLAKLASPFVSVAEKVRSFQSRASEQILKQSIFHDGSIVVPSQKAKALTLTRPKEPELETAQRVRPVRVKSAAELEEEMLSKFPKFKARPLNKKILEAPSLPPLPKTTPQLPEFEEFHLKTKARALQHSGTLSSMDSNLIADKEQCQIATATAAGVLTEPRPPHLETALRSRPPKVKSSEELEQEELEKIPKFKARPFNSKIFCSRGDLGLFRNPKRQVTTPAEFHFATDERLPAPSLPPLPPLTELFNKLSLNSEPKLPPRLTVPQPFHLLTQDRGAEKERKFLTELQEHQQREQQARVPKANPYPYTTDYPVIPPKPIPKDSTKPEPFQLESLMRHEEELQRMMEERARIDKEEAGMRKFRAQPIISNCPLHVSERPRKPLTEVQEFKLHADIRAVERAGFDQKVKDRENLYKRLREEYESAKKEEEERAVKMMRKTMLIPARPLPSFDNPFLPQRSSKELTKPKSPKLRVNNRRKDRRRRSSFTSTMPPLHLHNKIQMR